MHLRRKRASAQDIESRACDSWLRAQGSDAAQGLWFFAQQLFSVQGSGFRVQGIDRLCERSLDAPCMHVMQHLCKCICTHIRIHACIPTSGAGSALRGHLLCDRMHTGHPPLPPSHRSGLGRRVRDDGGRATLHGCARNADRGVRAGRALRSPGPGKGTIASNVRSAFSMSLENGPRPRSFELSQGMLRSRQVMIRGFEILTLKCCAFDA